MAASAPAFAASKADLESSSKAALNQLVSQNPGAKALNAKAVAVLVFPTVTKAGFMVGGQFGEGVLWRKGKPVGYYNTAGASYGLQAGAQQYGYAMFFMNQKALDSLEFDARFRSRRRPERRGRGLRHGQERHVGHADGGHLRFRLLAEGVDGRRRDPGQQDHQIKK